MDSIYRYSKLFDNASPPIKPHRYTLQPSRVSEAHQPTGNELPETNTKSRKCEDNRPLYKDITNPEQRKKRHFVSVGFRFVSSSFPSAKLQKPHKTGLF